MNIENISKL